jgi:hypothetical protein
MNPRDTALLLALLACRPALSPVDIGSGGDTNDTAGANDTSDTGGDTGGEDTGAGDTGSGDTGDTTDTADTSDTGGPCDTDCGEGGFCDLPVSDIALSYANPTAPHVLRATSGAGTISVEDIHFADGCCPEVSVYAVASMRSAIVEATYSRTDDLCDCYTGLALSYTLSCVPAGTWELRQGDASATVTVE